MGINFIFCNIMKIFSEGCTYYQQERDNKMYADYNNCLVNLACSILKEFGAAYSHPTLPLMDKLLQNQHRNVVILLLDGMGADAIRHHLDSEGFFSRNLLGSFSSVYPPTTTSATISIMTGLNPCEHGWLGWKQYFSELDRIIIPFRNTDFYSGEKAADYDAAWRYMPYKSIFDQINEAGAGKAYYVSMFGTTHIDSFDELTRTIANLCSTTEKKFIYAYWHQPDTIMHSNGYYDESVTDELRHLENEVEKMSENLSDTLLIVTADHGHKNITYYTLTDYPEILKMLKRPPSMESRASVFHVSEEYLTEFPTAFKNAFGDDFLLFSKEDVKQSKLFGCGVPHAKFDEFIGDYLAVSVTGMGIVYSDSVIKFRSEHAGTSEQEMMIPFIAIEKK